MRQVRPGTRLTELARLLALIESDIASVPGSLRFPL